MSEQYANNAQTILLNAIDNSITTITVASVTGFPTTPQFRILIDDEILLVTAISGTTWTVQRAVEPTAGIQTAIAHPAGAGVYCILTRQALLALPSTAVFFNELPSGSIDGSNHIFNLLNTPSELMLFLNGLLQLPAVDYTLSGNTIIMIIAPSVGDTLVGCYII